jgi:hypothetical protein
MSETIRSGRNTGQSPTSLSIEALEEIVRNCQRNEERLHDLERHTRHERKKAERLLQQTHRTMQNRDSQNTSIVDNVTTNENSHADDHRPKTRPSNEFFVALDDEDDDDDENANHRHRLINNNNKPQRQDKNLLERVEKLLAGDGTTTSSDVMSSQERQKKIVEKPTSPIQDDLDQKSLHVERKSRLESRQLPSACSIENDLSAVDRLLSERTPINNHRIKSDIRLNHENQVKKTIDYNDEKKKLSDQRDRQFYERLNNYVQTGRFVSPETDRQTTTTDDETYQSKSRPARRINSKDDELADLARRCEDLLSRLHTQRDRAQMLENSNRHYEYYQRPTRHRSSSYESNHYSRHRSLSPTPSPAPEPPPPMSLQQSLELLRPEFVSRSRQRARRIRLLREEREHNAEIDRERRKMLLFSCTTCCTNPANRTVSSASSSRQNISYIIPYDRSDSSRVPLTYRQMKKATKKKYDQLPEVKDQRLRNQMEDIRRRNFLRAKVFRARLRQHVARNGRTNIDESLTMIDT